MKKVYNYFENKIGETKIEIILFYLSFPLFFLVTTFLYGFIYASERAQMLNEDSKKMWKKYPWIN